MSVTLLLGACTKYTDSGTGNGTLSMRLSIDSQTRTFAGADALRETAQVRIYKADFSGMVRSYTYSSMPSTIYLAADSYRVDVLAGESITESPAPASWDKKSYKGSAHFDITDGKDTDVEVVAGVSNAVTKVTFDETVAASFNPGYTLTIGLDAEDTQTQLVYDESNSGSEGYFIVAGLDEPSFTWTFSAVLTKHNREFTKSGIIEGLQPGKMYKMNVIYTVKDGDLDFSLYLDQETDKVDDTIVFDPVSTGLASPDPYELWACHATIRADIDPSDSEGNTVEFAYTTDMVKWETVEGINESPGAWKVELTGLSPATEYTCRLLISGEPVGDDMRFMTDSAPQIPNGSFEHASKVSGGDFYKFYDPDCGVPGCTTKFWGSGNGDEESKGSASMGYPIAEIDTGDKVDGNQSVKTMTKYAMVKLAAGNLFTGYFAGMVSTSGGKVNFGRPWTSRPTALRIYCKYKTGKMDRIEGSPSGVNLNSSMYDRAQVKVALGTWNNKKYGGTVDCPILVNTTDISTFVDFYTDESTIANGDVIIYNDGYEINRQAKVTTPTDVWIEYTIPIMYRNLNAYPTHIVISCASSQYGDYFSGSTESMLWIDAAELIYE